MYVKLPEAYLDLVRHLSAKMTPYQMPDGRYVHKPGQVEPNRGWNIPNQQFIFVNAYLGTEPTTGAPRGGSDKLLTSVIRAGDFLTRKFAADGTVRWNMRGVRFDRRLVDQRLTYFWLLAYQRMKEVLDGRRRRTWAQRLQAACTWLIDKRIRPHARNRRFTSHHVGTGTNHFALYLSTVYQGGLIFARPQWCDLTTRVMRRLCRDQHPDGYWEEHDGPATGYNTLTFTGVATYYLLSGDREVLPALRRGKDFHLRFTYPDGVACETIDGRMRHRRWVSPWGHFGFSLFPDGRRYARLLLTETLKQGRDQVTPEATARMLENYLYYRPGPQGPIPQEKGEYTARLRRKALIRKAGHWVWALSGIVSPRWPQNPFCLDRQNHLSLWHRSAGLIIDGSNSKCQPEPSTFRGVGGSQAPFMPRASSLTAGAKKTILRLDYGSFLAHLEVQAPSRRRVLVCGRLPRVGEQPVVMTLNLSLAPGGTLTTGAGNTYRLSERPLDLVGEELGGWLSYGKWKLTVPPGARFLWPWLPFNSYSRDHRSTLAQAVALVSCELCAERPLAEWRVTVGG